MKEKLEAFLTECPDCTLDDFCRHFETECSEIATPSGEAPMGGPFGILQVIRLIRDNWDTLSAMSGGRIGDFIRFVVANWSSIQDIIENLGDRDIFETIKLIVALVRDFIDSRQLVVGDVPASVAAEHASDEEKAFAAAVCDAIAADFGLNLDALKARFELV